MSDLSPLIVEGQTLGWRNGFFRWIGGNGVMGGRGQERDEGWRGRSSSLIEGEFVNAGREKQSGREE